jgi:hypothetical protein
MSAPSDVLRMPKAKHPKGQLMKGRPLLKGQLK